MAQPPGVHARLQTLTRLREGLYLAGEQALASSLNAVLLSGERAAKAVVTERRPGAASP
jgi:chromosome segregation ATPase